MTLVVSKSEIDKLILNPKLEDAKYTNYWKSVKYDRQQRDLVVDAITNDMDTPIVLVEFKNIN